jgi:hypothetical protein
MGEQLQVQFQYKNPRYRTSSKIYSHTLNTVIVPRQCMYSCWLSSAYHNTNDTKTVWWRPKSTNFLCWLSRCTNLHKFLVINRLLETWLPLLCNRF